jgi:hypothetical protein
MKRKYLVKKSKLGKMLHKLSIHKEIVQNFIYEYDEDNDMNIFYVELFPQTNPNEFIQFEKSMETIDAKEIYSISNYKVIKKTRFIYSKSNVPRGFSACKKLKKKGIVLAYKYEYNSQNQKHIFEVFHYEDEHDFVRKEFLRRRGVEASSRIVESF